MIYEHVSDFANELQSSNSLIGLDLGTKTIGVAVSDTTLSIATPIKTIKRKNFSIDAGQLLEIISTKNCCGIIIGLPKNMDGTEGPRAQSTRAFGKNFSSKTMLPITFWDERLSTVAAEKALLEADTSRKRRSEVIDHVAAAYILQGFLDRLKILDNC